MATNRRCASEGCSAVATGRRVGGKWRREDYCRRCLAATRIGDVVRGLTDKRLRYVEKELDLLRFLETILREQNDNCEEVATVIWTKNGNVIGRTLCELDTLRALQAQDPTP